MQAPTLLYKINIKKLLTISKFRILGWLVLFSLILFSATASNASPCPFCNTKSGSVSSEQHGTTIRFRNSAPNSVPNLQNESTRSITDTIVEGEPEIPPAILPNVSEIPSLPVETEIGDTIAVPPAAHRGTGTILGARVDYTASDSIFFDAINRKVYLYGNVEVTYGRIHLTAGYVELDFRRNELYATGIPDSLGLMHQFPIFTEDPHSFQSKQMWYNFETRRGRTIDVITEEAEGFLHGGVVKIHDDRVIHVQDGKFTTCDNPEPHFHIAFNRAKMIPDDKIITSFAYLVVAGIPTPLIVPFGFFPNRRGQASGILMPSYGESANRGFYLENGGFYWAVNDNMDLSLTGDIYSRGSWGLRLGSNYRVRYRYSGSLNLAYAINILGEPGLPGYERSRDFRIMWNHNQDPAARPNSVFRASVNAGSSESSRFNPVSHQDFLSNTFSSNVGYSATLGTWGNFSANFRHSQNTLNRSVDLSLPEISFNVNRIKPFSRPGGDGRTRWFEDITINYSMNARNDLRTADSLLFRRETLRQFRNGIRHSIPISHSFRLLRHLNFSSSLNYNMLWYFSSIRKRWDPSTITLPGQAPIHGRTVIDTIPGFNVIHDFSFSSSMSTRLFGLVQFREGPVRAIRHVVTPSVGFSMRPDFGSPFWGYYQSYFNPRLDREVRYAIFEQGIFGGPSPGRSGSLNFSLTNNLEMKVRDRRDTANAGERKINLLDNFTITGGYDFARDSLRFSDIVVSARTRLFDRVDLTHTSSWTLYETDATGRRINRFLWDTRGVPFRLNNTTWSFSLGYTLGNDRNAQRGGNGMMQPPPGVPPGIDNQAALQQPAANIHDQIHRGPDVVNFEVPWSLQFNYTFNYTSLYNPVKDSFTRTLIQTLDVNGSVSLTPNWRIGFRTGYDFDRNEITYTSIDVHRDLHCWEMTFNWIPFGFRQSYNFTIRVKASVLQDLKLTRRTHHLDRAFQGF